MNTSMLPIAASVPSPARSQQQAEPKCRCDDSTDRRPRGVQQTRKQTEKPSEIGDSRVDIDNHDAADVPDGSFANVLDATVEPVPPLEPTPVLDSPLLIGTETSSASDVAVSPPSTNPFPLGTQATVTESSELVTPHTRAAPGVVNDATDRSLLDPSQTQVDSVKTSLEGTQGRTLPADEVADSNPERKATYNAASQLDEAASSVVVPVDDGVGDPVVVAETPASPLANATRTTPPTANTSVSDNGDGANQSQTDSQPESALGDGESSDLPQDKVAFDATRAPATDNGGKQLIQGDGPVIPGRVDFTPSADIPLAVDTPSDAITQLTQLTSNETKPVNFLQQRTTTPDALTQLSTLMSGRLDEAGRLPARLEIELDPPELGRLNVELTDSRHGITAKITASRESTAVLIEHQLAGLKQTLQDSGIEVQEFEVTYDATNSESGDGQPESQAGRAEEMENALRAGRLRREIRAADASSDQPAARRATRDSGRVDLHA